MKANRKTGILIGILFIVGTFSGIVSHFFTGAMVNSDAYFAQIASEDTRFIVGSLLILLMGFSLAFIPIILYPILKKHNHTMALGYVVLRGAIETVTYLMIWLCMLLLLFISKSYAAWDMDMGEIEGIVAILLRLRELSSLIIVFVFSAGALLFYFVLYQSKLIPRWLSLWGVFAIVLHLATGFLVLFELQTEESPFYMIMNFPIFLQEMVMAIRLIVKGFDLKPFNKHNYF